MEFLQLYISGFWVWLGITIGMCLIPYSIAVIGYAIISGIIESTKGRK